VSEPDYQRMIDVLLVGGGIAAASAAAELRAGGFEGSMALVTREQDPPYHRPPITKGYLRGTDEREFTLIHDESWWWMNDVELLIRTPVVAMDTELKTARLGNFIAGYRQALVATGAMVRRLQAEGAQRDGIHYLRVLANADALRADAEQAERVAIVGGSYIATEVAASLTSLGKECTIVCQEELPLERGFGATAGRFVYELLSGHGIKFETGADVAEFAGEGDDGRVSAVVCADGRRIEADLVVVGVGANPDVALARKAGLDLGESGGIACDARLRTSAEGVFAAGDVCEYDSVVHGRRLRIEHEEVAAAQGRHVARAMLGSEDPYDEVPYFWSDLADWTTLEYVGPAASWDEEIVRGDPAAGEFSVFYVQDGRVVAGLAVGRPDDLQTARELLVSGESADALR
jgi:3-phenylpropionate/trans-cinnamate dioxygenase ferredoxin reductase subunit